jgi:hypothetical protein
LGSLTSQAVLRVYKIRNAGNEKQKMTYRKGGGGSVHFGYKAA